MMLAAIILAAGESTRMGSPKALLPFNGKTFIRGVVDLLTAGGLSPIIVVVGAHAELVRHELAGLHVRVTTNHGYRAGQLSSLQKGLKMVRESPATGVLVHPVDHPAVRAETVRAILECFAAGQAPVVAPTCNGRRGHPVIFSANLFDELMNAPAETGARAVVWRHAQDIVEVTTDDVAIVQSIDTPEDYELLLSMGG
ncbi:MAG: nucleotidyltransferase family protein [Ignavibacteria bacterium]|nr:nucleotidyltransferase family protein [Ignavibacteria bacterium]